MVVAAGDPGERLAHGVAHGVLPLLHGDVEVHEHEGAVSQELGTGGATGFEGLLPIDTCCPGFPDRSCMTGHVVRKWFTGSKVITG